MLQAVERYMKQAMVDRATGVSSAALVSCRHIAQHSPDVVKRWVAEVQEAVQSDKYVVYFVAELPSVPWVAYFSMKEFLVLCLQIKLSDHTKKKNK